MPRPRKHEDAAARYRAYRERTVRIDRAALEGLLAAVDAAADAGDPVARLVRTGDADGLLRNLAHYFRSRLDAPG